MAVTLNISMCYALLSLLVIQCTISFMLAGYGRGNHLFVHIPCSQGGSHGSSCFGDFPPRCWCCRGIFYLMVLEMNPLYLSFLLWYFIHPKEYSYCLGGPLPFWSIMEAFDDPWDDSCHLFLLCSHHGYVVLREIRMIDRCVRKDS